MKPSLLIPLLIAVFMVATFATAFALTLIAAPSAVNSGFLARLLRNAYAYGWAAGLGVTAVFVFLRR